MEKKKILLADDEAELSRAVGAILTYSNYDVDLVYNGKDAAKKALEKNIDTVVFDRGGYIYHGVVKELAEAAREGGLKF